MTGKTWAELGVKAGDVVEYVSDDGAEQKGFRSTVFLDCGRNLRCNPTSGMPWYGAHSDWRIVSRATPEPLALGDDVLGPDLAYDVIHYRSADDIAAGLCPVPKGADVTVWFRHGRAGRGTHPDWWSWGDEGSGTITAFLIHTPQSTLTDADFIALVRGASGTAKDMFGYWISGDRDNPTFDAVMAYLNEGEE